MATRKNNKDFSKGKIYKIKCKTDNKDYIGSTVEPIEKRLLRHNIRAIYENKNNIESCKFIQKIRELGIEQFKITLIEKWPCDNFNQLKKREGYYQVINNTVNNGMNSQYESLNPFVLHLKKIQKDKEYREGPKREELLQKKRDYGQENKDTIAIKTKEYRKGSKREEILEKKRNYYEKNKETISVKTQDYRNNNKEKIKEQNKKYFESNKETVLEKQKKYYEDNKEAITERRKNIYHQNIEKNKEAKREQYKKNNIEFDCECGSIVNKNNQSHHFKTKKHQNYITFYNCECGIKLRISEKANHKRTKKHQEYLATLTQES
jgi:hypothetical protein